MRVSIFRVLRFLLVNYGNRGEVLGTPNANDLLRNERTYEAEKVFPHEAILNLMDRYKSESQVNA